MDRLTFREIKQEKGLFSTRTSGSTGTAVEVQKYLKQKINLQLHTALFNRLHKIDTECKTLKINPTIKKPHWLNNIFYSNKFVDGDFEQLISYPSLFPEDLSRYKKVISYGEPWIGVGIDLYSSEEFGCIAIQCPHNMDNLHVMLNLDIRCTSDGMRITDNDHPYLKDYEIGDYAEHTKCDCNIKLPSISHVKGRIRNLIKMPDGTKKWPQFGLLNYPSIKRFQVFQKSLTELELHIDGEITDGILSNMKETLGFDFDIKIVYGDFRNSKHEEFICEI